MENGLQCPNGWEGRHVARLLHAPEQLCSLLQADMQVGRLTAQLLAQ